MASSDPVVDAQSHLSITELLNFLPSEPKLSYSRSRQSPSYLNLFWTHDPELETLQQKILTALQLLNLSWFPILVQFWAPKIINDKAYLTTSDQPFGFTVFVKSLCSYRKLFAEYKYSAGEGQQEGNLGPPGRVFINGFDEFCPQLKFYNREEYPLREGVLGCGVEGLLTLPIFGEDTGEKCIGVLELVTVWYGSNGMPEYIGRISDALKAVGLRCLDVCRPFNPFNPFAINGGERLMGTLYKIEKELEVICNKHKIPLAQTWFLSSDGIHAERVMMTTKMGSYVLGKKNMRARCFQKDCTYFPIRKGQGVVGEAFLSGKVGSCKDLTSSSINEHPLAPSACKAGLTSSFAVCLRSEDSENDVYVIEFFLPDQTSLDSLAVATFEHFQSFNIAAAQNFQKEFSGEVKISENEKLEDVQSNENQGNDAEQKGSGFGSQEKEDNFEPSETGDMVVAKHQDLGKKQDGNANVSECESDPGAKKNKAEPFLTEQSCHDTTPANGPGSVSSPRPQATTMEDVHKQDEAGS